MNRPLVKRPPLVAPPGLEGLTDAELAETVLSNWHQLNAVLRFRQPAAVLRRLLLVEQGRVKNRGPRRNVLIRLARALTRAEGRERLARL